MATPERTRVLVTGATGLVGRALLAQLEQRPVRVSATTRRPSEARAAAPAVEWIEADLLEGCPRSALEGCEVVLHCAGAMPADDDECLAINRDATVGLLDRALEAGVRRFVYLSSSAVYGDSSPALADEDTPRAGTSAYARSKIAAEDALFSARGEGWRACVLRPCMITGPGDHNLWPALHSILCSPTIVLPGNGQALLDVVDSRDVAHAALAVALDVTDVRDAYNVTGGVPTSVRRILELCAARLDLAPRIEPIELTEAHARLELAARRGEPAPFPPALLAICAHEKTYSRERARWDLGVRADDGLHPLVRRIIESTEDA